jgi:hypothetical protein
VIAQPSPPLPFERAPDVLFVVSLAPAEGAGVAGGSGSFVVQSAPFGKPPTGASARRFSVSSP